jgi:hypothetical protein
MFSGSGCSKVSELCQTPDAFFPLSLSHIHTLRCVGEREKGQADLPFDNAHASQKLTMKSSRSLKPSTVSYNLCL